MFKIRTRLLPALARSFVKRNKAQTFAKRFYFRKTVSNSAPISFRKFSLKKYSTSKKEEQEEQPKEETNYGNVAIGVVVLAALSYGIYSYMSRKKDTTPVKVEEDEDAIRSNIVSLEKFPSFPDSCKSLLKKYLTEDVFNQGKGKKTKCGAGLERVINSGVQNPDSSIGVYAPDEEAYQVWSELFDNVIFDYHGGYGPKNKHTSDLNVENLKGTDPDPEGKYVISTRIRVGRNLKGYPLAPGISKKQRLEVEKKVVDALATMEDDLSGKYFPLSGMKEDDRKQLVADHFLFKRGDRFLEAAFANRCWPEGRGIFHSQDKKFLVWVNEEDELRIISMQKGSNVREVFGRLSRAIQKMQEKLQFAYNDHLGCISSCPTNLGTAMRASVHIKIPNVSKQPNFKEWCAKNELSVRGIHGEHSKSEGGVYDISNKRRLGLSEVECVQTMYNGVVKLIEWEKSLEGK